MKILEPAREVPILSEVDVAVVGGGTAGVMAAVGAAREGARTCVIERNGQVGGMLDVGLMGHFGNMYRTKTDGRELIMGAPRELLRRVVEEGATPFHDLEEALRAGMHIFYRHTHAGMECLRMLNEARVDLWLHATFARAARAPQGGYDLFIECKGGRRAIRARQVIDCTGEADVAFSLGAAMQEEKTLRFSWGLLFEMGLVAVDRYLKYLDTCEQSYPEWDAWLAKRLGMTIDQLEEDRYWREWRDGRPRAWRFRREIVRAVEAGDLDLRRALPEGGMVRYGWDGFWPEPWHGPDTVTANVCMVTGLNPSDPRHVSIAEVGARTYALDFVHFLRKYLPGFERAVIRTISGQTVPRGGREIVGEDRMRPEDYGGATPREDAVCVVGSMGAALPLGMFAPKGFADLLVAGRCADTGYSVRGSVCCMAAGFSCGVISAIAAKQGRTPMQLDRAQWRDALKRHGVLLAPGAAAGTAIRFQELPGVPAPDGADGLARAKKLS